MRQGQPVDVTVDSFPGRVFKGTVSFIAQEAQFTPRNVQTKDERATTVFAVRVELPNVSGFSVCNKLRRNDDTRYIPLVMYASDVSSDVFDQHRNLKTHADDYLKLPFGQEELLASVGGLMSLPEPGAVPPPSAPAERLEVEVEAAKPPSESARLEMAEFEQEFAEMEDAPAKADADIADEMEMAFDGLLDEPAPETTTPAPAPAATKPPSKPVAAGPATFTPTTRSTSSAGMATSIRGDSASTISNRSSAASTCRLPSTKPSPVRDSSTARPCSGMEPVARPPLSAARR